MYDTAHESQSGPRRTIGQEARSITLTRSLSFHAIVWDTMYDTAPAPRFESQSAHQRAPDLTLPYALPAFVGLVAQRSR